MTQNKKEAIEFCMNKFVTNKIVDIWLTVRRQTKVNFSLVGVSC